MKVPHTFDATSIPVSRLKGQILRSPGPLMLTHIVRHISRTARPTNFKLGTRMEDNDPHQPRAPWPPRSKVKVARSRDQSEPSWPNPNAVPVSLSLEAGEGIPCRPNPAATLLVLSLMFYTRLLREFNKLWLWAQGLLPAIRHILNNDGYWSANWMGQLMAVTACIIEMLCIPCFEPAGESSRWCC